MYKDCYDYWSQHIKEYIDCCDGTFENISDNDIKNVVDSLLDSDYFWSEIDSMIDERLSDIINEKE